MSYFRSYDKESTINACAHADMIIATVGLSELLGYTNTHTVTLRVVHQGTKL